MQTYIALLRGINVSGQKKIKMAELKEHLESLKFNNVTTYIQSGNIVFSSAETDKLKIASAIENKIQSEYGFEVPTLIKSPADLEILLKENEFKRDPLKSTDRMYFTLLYSLPEQDRVDNLKTFNYEQEEYILRGANLYFYSPNGYGKAKMNNNFFENKLKVLATTRNWKTINKLIEISKQL